MPIFEYICSECGKTAEILIMASDPDPACPACGSGSMTKILSAPSSHSVTATNSMPGPQDTSCCGKTPDFAGCAGPGSCCGKTF